MDYTQLSVAELRQAAKELGIPGCSNKKKSEIIELISAKNAEEDTTSKQVSAEQKEAPVRASESSRKEAAPVSKRNEEAPVRVVRSTADETQAPREERIIRRVVVPENRSEVRENVRPREERPAYREERPANREERPAYREERPYRDEAYQPREDRRPQPQSEYAKLDSGIQKSGILEIAPEQSFGFIRNENYLPSPDDIYVSPALI